MNRPDLISRKNFVLNTLNQINADLNDVDNIMYIKKYGTINQYVNLQNEILQSGGVVADPTKLVLQVVKRKQLEVKPEEPNTIYYKDTSGTTISYDVTSGDITRLDQYAVPPETDVTIILSSEPKALKVLTADRATKIKEKVTADVKAFSELGDDNLVKILEFVKLQALQEDLLVDANESTTTGFAAFTAKIVAIEEFLNKSKTFNPGELDSVIAELKAAIKDLYAYNKNAQGLQTLGSETLTRLNK